MLCAVVTVIVDIPEPPDTDEGLKLTEECGGRELALKTTVPVNPFNAPMLTLYEALDAALTFWLDGNAEIEKSPPELAPVTLTEIVV